VYTGNKYYTCITNVLNILSCVMRRKGQGGGEERREELASEIDTSEVMTDKQTDRHRRRRDRSFVPLSSHNTWLHSDSAPVAFSLGGASTYWGEDD
jgi:hypothetical protein